VARHRTKAITVYRQGDVDYLVNEEPGSHATRFAAAHGPCAPPMAFRVVDVGHAYRRALELGAEPADPAEGSLALDVPAITGIGGSLLYFLDRYGAKGSAFDDEFAWLGTHDPKPEGQGLYYLDHLTHNVGRGRMDVWAGFYERLFNFREIRCFGSGQYPTLPTRRKTRPAMTMYSTPFIMVT
jgi:4-hydroxyphenylpyruvate dioxygenase